MWTAFGLLAVWIATVLVSISVGKKLQRGRDAQKQAETRENIDEKALAIDEKTDSRIADIVDGSLHNEP